MKNLKGILVLIAVIVIFFFWLIVHPILQSNGTIPSCEYDLDEYVVQDIIQVSSGGGWGTDTCILQTDKGKIRIKSGKVCAIKTGDTFYKQINHRNCAVMNRNWKVKK